MTRSSLLLAAVATTALLAAGCGAQGPDVGSGDGAPPPAAGACLEGATECDDMGGDMGAPGPEAPVTGGGDGVDAGPGEEPTAEAVEPTDGLVDLREVGWDRVEVDTDDQSRLTVYWWSGVAPCNALSEVQVETTDQAVTLTVVEGSEPADEPQACIELAQYKQTTVTLDEELGPRSVLDGAEG